MFEFSKTGNIQWDGKTIGESKVPDGTYFYILKAKGLDNQTYDLNGYLNIFQ